MILDSCRLGGEIKSSPFFSVGDNGSVAYGRFEFMSCLPLFSEQFHMGGHMRQDDFRRLGGEIQGSSFLKVSEIVSLLGGGAIETDAVKVKPACV